MKRSTFTQYLTEKYLSYWDTIKKVKGKDGKERTVYNLVNLRDYLMQCAVQNESLQYVTESIRLDGPFVMVKNKKVGYVKVEDDLDGKISFVDMQGEKTSFDDVKQMFTELQTKYNIKA